MTEPAPSTPEVTPPARLPWDRGPAAPGEAAAALIGVRPGTVLLLTDTPVPPGGPVRVELEGPAAGPTAAATVLAVTAIGPDRFLVRLGLMGSRGATAFLCDAAGRLGMPGVRHGRP